MTNINPWYITGLCDGESTFTYSRSGNFAFNLYFAVKFTATDEELINLLYNFFKVGKIYKVKASLPTKNSGFTKKSLYYRVSNLSELGKIIEHFDEYPLCGVKAKQYNIWKEIVLLKIKYKRKNIPEIRERIENLLLRLSELSPRNQKTENKNVPTGTVYHETIV
jgi:hypothetical protein